MTTSDESDDALVGRRSAKDPRMKVMDLLARRSHSELELRGKLEGLYADDDITDAIDHAKSKGWLAAPEELSQQVAAKLDHKNKGHHFVNQFLKNKGLPPVEKDELAEVDKAFAVLLAKMKDPGPYSPDERNRAVRMLAGRGFDSDTIRQALARAKTSVDED